MANLAKSAVTVLESWEMGDRQGRERRKCVRAKLVLTGQGGLTDKIPASVFGFQSLFEVHNAVTDGNTWLPATVSADNTALLLFSAVQATDANRANPANITDTVFVTVSGF